jgi:penicillin-binding protein 1C
MRKTLYHMCLHRPGRAAAILALMLALPVLLALADRIYPLPATEGRFAVAVAAADGSPMRIFPDEKGVWRYAVTPDEVSPLYLQALLGYEDRWFRYHPGVNPLAMVRAVWQNLTSGRVVSGGSTLTMQVARMMVPQPRTVAGKAGQMMRGLQLEWHWPKDRILGYYLNHAPFGGPVEGVQAASYIYLGKPARELSHAEAALLAVLPQAPSRLRPDRAPEKAQRARDKVLDRLAANGTWSAETVADARRETVFAQRFTAPLDCPLLARRLYRRHSGQRVLATFIDLPLQLQLGDLARRYAFRLPPSGSVAILVVDNTTMGVKAYVGSAGFLNRARFGHVDMARAVRSPGSTLKPMLYGLALDAGLIHSQSLLTDAPRVHAAYRPGNFGNGFSGPVSAAEALRRSLNVPAVQLLEAYGPGQLAARLRSAGMRVTFPDGGRPNLSMILGGVGTDLASLVSAYTALARNGLAGRLRLQPSDPLQERFLMSPGAAWIVRDMLRHPFPERSRLSRVQGRAAYAWKTGTSYGFRDAWALAVSNAVTVGVWVGRPDGTPSPGQFGAATAAPLLLQVLEYLDAPRDEAPRPTTVTRRDVCWPSGLSREQCRQADIPCDGVRKAWVLRGQVPPTLPDPTSPLSGGTLTVWVNSATGLRVDGRCPVDGRRQVKLALWPRALEPWLPIEKRRSAMIPAPDPLCGRAPRLAESGIRISGLAPGSRLRRASDRRDPPSVNLAAIGGDGRRHWFLNGRPVGQTSEGHQPAIALRQAGEYQLAVVDEGGNADMISFEVLP